MRVMLVIAVLFVAGVWKWSARNTAIDLDPTLAGTYVAVYGRSSCGYTRRMVAALEAAGIAHVMRSVDDAQLADHLHRRMDAAGLDTGYYLLPVVEVRGQLSIRPDVAVVLRQVEQSALR